VAELIGSSGGFAGLGWDGDGHGDGAGGRGHGRYKVPESRT
jgi:hypothetical protein